MPVFQVFKKNIDSLLAAIIGFCVIYLFARHGGIGVSPDSVVYLSAAENLQKLGTLTDFTNKPMVDFPALYPLFLNGFSKLTGLKPLVFAPVLNALLFALVIYLCGLIMQAFTVKSTLYKRCILVCIVTAPCLLEVYSMLWSETVFIFLLLLFIMAMHRYLKTSYRWFLILAAFMASLASVTRYAGIAIIATGGLLLLLNTKQPLRRKLIDLLLYSLISPLLLIINLIRNHVTNGTLTGYRQKSISSLRHNLHSAGAVFYDWLPFSHSNYFGVKWFVTAVLLVLLGLIIKLFKDKKQVVSYDGITAVFSLVYLLFMLIMATVSRFETLNSRFLAPAFIPLLLVSSHAMLPLYQKVSKSRKKRLRILAIVAFLCFQYGQLSADYATWDGVKDAGIPGYTEDSWKQSETVKFIQKDSLPFQNGYTIYSNANDAVYFFTGRVGKFLPHKESSIELQELLKTVHCYLVWFNDGENPDLLDKNSIIHLKKMKLLKQFSDGAIYENE